MTEQTHKTSIRYEKDGDFLHINLFEPVVSATCTMNIGAVEIYFGKVNEHSQVIGLRVWGASKLMPDLATLTSLQEFRVWLEGLGSQDFNRREPEFYLKKFNELFPRKNK